MTHAMISNRRNGARVVHVLIALLAMGSATAAGAQTYTARQEGDLIRLQDTARQVSVAIVPSVGNMAIEMKVKGHDVLRWPYSSVADFKAKPGMHGIPFMGPWANRLDEQAFYANGRRYAFDLELGNIRGKIPIPGFLTTNDRWTVVDVSADGRSARATSRLEFFRQPLWMAQFPFAHTIDMTYTLQDGVLQVTTRIENLSAEPMPVSIGFHPYFQLTDSPRDEWTVSLGARTHWLLTQTLVPTGETQPIEKLFPDPRAIALREWHLDHVFSDLVRDAAGRAVMTVKGRSQALDVVVGPNYKAMVVYAPQPPAAGSAPPQGPAPTRNFICFEPMAAITNAMNLAHKGAYKELQTIAPGAVWEESFWVRPHGF
jgi:aldose 1-epimerase